MNIILILPKTKTFREQPQLEKAVEAAMDELKKNPPRAMPHHPPRPNYDKGDQ